ncbi:MAG: hypothetical protein IIY23_00410 [Erysipelotrichaceae bacterium]|nr:hypothetical protein [Erysipelotrichaceae bacterium]
MIDGKYLQQLIDEKRGFRIGARGICCECWLNKSGYWLVAIPRASFEMTVDELSVLDDPDYFHLTFSLDGGNSFESFLDLSQYEKLMVIE